MLSYQKIINFKHLAPFQFYNNFCLPATCSDAALGAKVALLLSSSFRRIAKACLFAIVALALLSISVTQHQHYLALALLSIYIAQHQHCIALALHCVSIALRQHCIALALLSVSIAQHQHFLVSAPTQLRLSIRITQRSIAQYQHWSALALLSL